MGKDERPRLSQEIRGSQQVLLMPSSALPSTRGALEQSLASLQGMKTMSARIATFPLAL